MKSSVAQVLLRSLLPPVALFALLTVLWYAVTHVFSIPVFILPSPVDVFEAISANGRALAVATGVTATAASAGFVLSCVIGCLVAFLFSQSAIIRQSCFPYAIFLQTVPIVAIAPLIILWFGTGFQSVVIVSFIISLFPVIANATAGLTALDRNHVALFTIYNASRWQILVKLRLPAAVPNLITGAKTSSGLAVIGAIVGEFFAGYGANQHGLGYLIIMTSHQLKTAYLFSAIFASTMLGIVIFGGVSLAGSAILRRRYQDQTH